MLNLLKSKNTRLIELLEKEENFISETMIKSDHEKDWSFKKNEVKIGCLNGLFCFVEIEGVIFGLNGNAISKYNVRSVHEAKKTIKGKSISYFINRSLKL